MGEEDIEGDIYGKGRDKLSSRLQSGMNLQICFVNDSVDGSDAEEDSGSNATPRVANRDSRFLFSRESSVGSPSSGTSPKVSQKETGGLVGEGGQGWGEIGDK